MRIIFSAVLSNPPFTPGSAWHRLHYLMGLKDLGHDVYFVEETYADACVDANGDLCSLAASENARIFSSVMHEAGLDEASALVCDGSLETVGLSFDRIVEVARSADLLINMSGHLSPGSIFEGPGRRAYFDTDPVFTQLWAAEYQRDLNLALHDVFVTSGANIGTDRSRIPDCGVKWIHTVPPVLVDRWETSIPPGDAFTEVTSWDTFGELSYEGQPLSSKRTEIMALADLPRRAGQAMEMAVKFLPEQDEPTVARLRRGGWALRDGAAIATLNDYRDYIHMSKAEIGIAKHAYAAANSGWFSDRTVEYLAAGRPAVVRATGFEEHVPTGVGLLSYRTADEAAHAVAEVNADTEKHSAAATEIAREYFDHRKVLTELLEALTA